MVSIREEIELKTSVNNNNDDNEVIYHKHKPNSNVNIDNNLQKPWYKGTCLIIGDSTF